MKRLVISIAVAAVALLGSWTVALAESTTGAANLHQFHGSGVSGSMSYIDTGSTLTVAGTAEGLTPGQTYLSLFYDNGSKVGGHDPCSPSSGNNITFPQMFIGFWNVNQDGTGTLNVVKDGPFYVPLNMVHTQSIRHAIVIPPMSEADAPVVACGEVHHVG